MTEMPSIQLRYYYHTAYQTTLKTVNKLIFIYMHIDIPPKKKKMCLQIKKFNFKNEKLKQINSE